MNTRFKQLLGLAGLSLFLLGPRCYGQRTRATESSDTVITSEINSLIARAALSLGDTHFIENETMPGLLRLWHKRQALGAFNMDLSNAFLFVMEENPEAFFSSMSDEPKVFSEWLKELPYLSFTWFNAPPCRLEAKRKQLIMILNHSVINDRKLSSLKDAVLARLSAIRCRQIQ